MKIMGNPGTGVPIDSDLMPKVIDLEEASERFGVSVMTLRRAIRAGQLKRYEIWGDRKVYVDPEEVERLREPRPRDE